MDSRVGDVLQSVIRVDYFNLVCLESRAVDSVQRNDSLGRQLELVSGQLR